MVGLGRELRQRLNVGDDIVFVVKRRQHPQPLAGLVGVLDQRELEVRDIVELGRRRTQGDEAEGAGVTRDHALEPTAIGGVRRQRLARALGVDRNGVILVAVHVEALGVPGVRPRVRDTRRALHARVRRAQAASQNQAHRAVDRVDGVDVGEPRALRAAQVAGSALDVLDRRLVVGDHGIAAIQNDGAEVLRRGRTGPIDAQANRAIEERLDGDGVVKELRYLAGAESLRVDGHHHQLVPRQRHAVGVETVELAIVVQVQRQPGGRVECLLALDGDNVRHAVQVGIQAGQAVAHLAHATIVGGDITIGAEQILAAHTHREDEAGATRRSLNRLRLGIGGAGVDKAIGPLLHDGRVVDIAIGDSTADVLVLVQVVALVPGARPDLLGRVEVGRLDPIVQPQAR